MSSRGWTAWLRESRGPWRAIAHGRTHAEAETASLDYPTQSKQVDVQVLRDPQKPIGVIAAPARATGVCQASPSTTDQADVGIPISTPVAGPPAGLFPDLDEARFLDGIGY